MNMLLCRHSLLATPLLPSILSSNYYSTVLQVRIAMWCLVVLVVLVAVA
jgi:hypothetical protein